MNRTNTILIATALAGPAASLAAALPEQTSWTDYIPTEHALWYEQPLEMGVVRGVFSNRLSNDLPWQVMDDFEVAHDASIQEVVFYGWAFHEADGRWALMNENISAFTVEIWSGIPTTYDDGCYFRPDRVVATKSMWLSQIDRVLTGDLAADGSFIERLAIPLDSPLPVSAGRRYGVRITATVIDSATPIGFKWAQTDDDRFAAAYDSVSYSCSPVWWYPGFPVYHDMAFELAGPGFGGIVHRQIADHDTGVHASTTNSVSDPTRVYDDFVSGFDGRIDAVSVYMAGCWNSPTGSGFGAAWNAESVEVAIHEVVDLGGGAWEPGELVGRTTVPGADLVSDPAFRQRVHDDGGPDREWERALITMHPPVPVENGKRYALSLAGTMVQAENSIVTAWAETVTSSLQDNGLSAVEFNRETGAYTPMGTDFAFTVHGLSTPWCGVADLAEPFGILDLSDISAFSSAFLAQEPAAELTGDGILDLSDITRFIESFLDGCPGID